MNTKHLLYLEDLDSILKTKGLERLRAKTLLVTGATGMLGRCLIDALMLYNHKQRGAEISIYAVGRNPRKMEEVFGDYYGETGFNILCQDVIRPFPKDISVDYIIPLASNTHPLAYSEFPIETIFTNVTGARHALDLAVRCKASLVYPSSVEVYGNARDDCFFNEDDTGILNLSTSRACYTESKRLCEALCQSYISEKGVDVKIARLCRVFGPTMQLTDTKASSQFINKALKNEDIVLKSSGKQFFSYIYVADAVSALLHILLNGDSGQAYNVSSVQCNVFLKDFAFSCAMWAGTSVVFDIPSEQEMRGYSVASRAVLDNSKLLRLNWAPKYSFCNAIHRTLEILKC